MAASDRLTERDIAPGGSQPIFSIGHSTRSLDELVAMLQHAEVGLLIDVRSFPRSRTNQQFNIDTLPAALSARGIEYLVHARPGWAARAADAFRALAER